MRIQVKRYGANALTLVGIASALFALLFALYGVVFWVIVGVVLSAIVDFFDGRLARFLDCETELGRRLDTGHDFLAFGVVPAVLLVRLHDHGLVFIFAAVIYVVATFVRLARFMKLRQTNTFTGLPAPAAGAPFVVALRFAMHGGHWLFAVLAIVFAGLMIAPFTIHKY